MSRTLQWDVDGRDWPHRERSRFVEAGGLRWHVQVWPAPVRAAPTLLLIHGTGSSTHSWRDVAPLLAEGSGIVSVDLPGHGFSAPAPVGRASIEGMAQALAALVDALGVRVGARVGHSAGASIAVQMALDDPAARHAAPPVVSLNGALLPLGGVAGALFSPLARALAGNSLMAQAFAWGASERFVLQHLLQSTGSNIDARGAELYGRLVASPGHVAGALAMMAQWDLPALAQRLPTLRAPLHLVAGERDHTVPPDHARRVQSLLPAASLQVLPALGHLAHEEAPQALADLVRSRVAAAPR